MPAAAPPAEVLPHAPAAEASAAAPDATAVVSVEAPSAQVPAPAAESAAETPADEAKSTDVPAAAPSEAPAAVQMKAAASSLQTVLCCETALSRPWPKQRPSLRTNAAFARQMLPPCRWSFGAICRKLKPCRTIVYTLHGLNPNLDT